MRSAADAGRLAAVLATSLTIYSNFLMRTLLLGLALTAWACGGATEPDNITPIAPLGRFTITDSLAQAKTVSAKGITITFASDSSYVWTGPEVHRAGKWHGSLEQFILLDTVAGLGVWLGVATEKRLEIRLGNNLTKYGFAHE